MCCGGCCDKCFDLGLAGCCRCQAEAAAACFPRAQRTPSLPTSQPSPPPCAAAAGVLSALEASRDALAKRVEGLVRCKNEFQARRRGRPWVGDGLLGQGQHR